jgi:DNA polymerase I
LSNKLGVFYETDLVYQFSINIAQVALAWDPTMISAFQDGVDIHTITAAKVNGVTPEEVTREMRSGTKMVNFGIIYGISAFDLLQRLAIPRNEAAEIIDAVFPRVSRDQRIHGSHHRGVL